MSRKMMLRWTAGVSALLLCVAVRVSWSDDGFDDLSAPVAKQPAVKVANPEPNAGELRQRIVELMSKRAERMSNDELTKAIEELSKTLTDQDTAADAELQKAIDQLQSVVAKFPGTPAAERGSRALQAIENPVKVQPRKGPAARPLADDGDEDSFSSRDEQPVPRTRKAPAPPVLKRN